MADIPYIDKTEEQKKNLLPKDQQNLANAAASARDFGGSDNPTLEGLKNFGKDAVSGTVDAVKDIGTELITLGATSGVGQVATSPLAKIPFVGPYLGKISPFMRTLRNPKALIGTAALTGAYKLGQEFEEEYRDTPVLDNPLVRGMQDAAGAVVSNLPFIKPDQPKVLTPEEMQAQLDLNDARAKARAEGTEMPKNKGEFSEQPSIGLGGYTPFNIRVPTTKPAETPAPEPAPATATTPLPDTDTAEPRNFGETFLSDGVMKGIPRDSDVYSEGFSTNSKLDSAVEMTPEEVARMKIMQENLRTPTISSRPEEGLKKFTDQQGNIMYGNDAVFSGQGAGRDKTGKIIEQNVPFARGGVPTPMSKEELAEQFDQMRKSGLSIEEREQRSKQLMADYFASQNTGNEPAPSEDSQMTKLEAKMLNDFENFKKSGREMTPEMENKAKLLANSVGRTFDKETGYSKEFSPEIMRIYQQGVKDGVIDPASIGRETNLDIANKERREREEQSRQGYEANRDEMEAERKIREESGGVMLSVGGKQVPATEANRALFDRENALKKQARAAGLVGSEVNTFVRDGMQKAKDDQYAKDVQALKDQLDISTAEANLEAKRRSLLPKPPERPSSGDIKNFINDVEKLGIKYDPDTGLFEDTEGFDDILDPNSSKYAKLQQLEHSEYFLQPPIDVMDKYDELTSAASTDPDGYSRAWADDGRLFKIFPDGSYEHTGWKKK